jgi:hypothetical protein
MVYTVRVPLWEMGTREVRTPARYHAASMIEAATVCSSAGALVLAPRDTDADGMPDGWEAHHVGNATAMSPDEDADGDGMINAHECIAGTSPLDRNSVLKLTDTRFRSGETLRITWESATNRLYMIERATSLTDGFVPVASNIVATPPTNTYVDTSCGERTLFYRIEVEQ